MSNHNNPEVDDSSTVFDADTVTSDDFPYLSTTIEDHHHQQQPNNNNNEAISITSSLRPSHECPPTSISELLRRINSQYHPAEPSTTSTATTISSTEEKDISIIHQESSSSSSSSQQSTAGERVTFNARWRSKFQQLCAYKQLHGNTNVLPSNNKSLYKWVHSQRADYKKLKANKKSPMTFDRIQLLESIGFEWVRPRDRQKNDSAWNKRFVELLEYKEKYGHTNVKEKDCNKSLNYWVWNQRSQYKLFQENRYSRITLKRIQKLDSIGFRWVLHHARVSKK